MEKVFTKKVVELGFPFIECKDQEVLDYLADKIEAPDSTITNVTCFNSKGDRKGFYNIISSQRARIAKITRESGWNEASFENPFFKDLMEFHTYKIHELD
jgi:hypothetical protein